MILTWAGPGGDQMMSEGNLKANFLQDTVSIRFGKISIKQRTHEVRQKQGNFVWILLK